MGKSIFKFLLNSGFDIKGSIKNYKFYNEIRDSGLFDAEFYKKTYKTHVKGQDPLTHYLTKGHKEGFFPSLNFDPDFYIIRYPDVHRAGVNPLFHYIAYGRNENKKIEKALSVRRKDEIIKTNKMLLNDYVFDEEPLVSIIVLNLNGLEHLQRLFANFDETIGYSNYEIIVVDNGSTDESVSFLKSLQSKYPLRIIENEKNESFSKANNDAAEIANGEYLVLLNNDIEPTEGWLNELMGVMLNNDNVGAVGAKLVFPFYYIENRINSFRIQHSGDIFAERMHPGCMYAVNKSNRNLDIFDNALNETTKCISVTGAVMLVKKDIYQQLGGLDENYTYGLEDVDFCLNLYENNLDTYYCGTALLFHHESSTRVKSKDYTKNDRNNFKFFWNKWGGYLSKNLLLDKINNRKFFTEKDLKIVIFNNDEENDREVSKMTKTFYGEGYEVNVIEDKYDTYIGNSTDILIRFSKDYSLEDMTSRDDLIVVDIGDGKANIVNLKDSNIIKTFDINEDTVCSDIVDNVEDVVSQSDEFLWDLKIK